MCIEGAYYGTPVIATRPLPCRYMQWLFSRRLAVHCTRVQDVVREAEAVIARRASTRAHALHRRAQRIFGDMRFPLDEIVALILRTAKRAQRSGPL